MNNLYCYHSLDSCFDHRIHGLVHLDLLIQTAGTNLDVSVLNALSGTR